MIALLFLACAGPSDTPRFDVGGVDTAAAETQTYICGDWAPWIAGRSFTWRVQGTINSYLLTRTVDVLDADGTVERSIRGDDVYLPWTGSQRGHCTEDGYFIDAEDYEEEGYNNAYTYTPGLWSIPTPRPLGAAWEESYTASWVDSYYGEGSFDATFTYAVTAEQIVSVAAGTGLASRVEMRNSSGTLVAERWYAVGLGLVQSIGFDEDGNPTGETELLRIEDAP